MKQQYVNEISQGDSAEWIIIMSTVRDQVLGSPRLNALKLFAETVFSLDYSNNLK